MGFFNKRKNLDKNELTQYKIQSADKTLTILLTDINDKRIIKVNDTEAIKLVRAKIKKTYSRKRQKITLAEDYIVFELHEKQDLTPEILESAVAEYEYEHQVFDNEGVYYLGKYTTSQYGNYFQITLIGNMIEEAISEIRKEIYENKRKTLKHREYANLLKVENSIPKMKQDIQEHFDRNSKNQQEHDEK